MPFLNGGICDALWILALSVMKTSQRVCLGLTFSIFKCHSTLYETVGKSPSPADFGDEFLSFFSFLFVFLLKLSVTVFFFPTFLWLWKNNKSLSHKLLFSFVLKMRPILSFTMQAWCWWKGILHGLVHSVKCKTTGEVNCLAYDQCS